MSMHRARLMNLPWSLIEIENGGADAWTGGRLSGRRWCSRRPDVRRGVLMGLVVAVCALAFAGSAVALSPGAIRRAKRAL